MNLQIAKMVVDSLKWMCFHASETDICVIDSIFSGIDQQKVQVQTSTMHFHPFG